MKVNAHTYGYRWSGPRDLWRQWRIRLTHWEASAGVRDSFYWMPSASNFKGVDSVVGTLDAGLYYSGNDCG